MAWLTNWGTRKEVRISEQAGTALGSYAVRIEIPFLSGMGTDYKDVRFTDWDGTTVFTQWHKLDNNLFFVQISTLEATGTGSFYMYYDNTTATQQISTTIFSFFDDFPGTVLDDSKWMTDGASGSITVSDGTLELTVPSSAGNRTCIKGSNTYDQCVVNTYGVMPSLINNMYAYLGIGQWTPDFRVACYNNAGNSAHRLAHYDGIAWAEHIEDTDKLGVWTEYELRFVAGTQTIFSRDDLLDGTLTPNTPGTLPPSFMVRPHSSNSAASPGTIKSNWIAVRPYVAKEPVVAIEGTEALGTIDNNAASWAIHFRIHPCATYHSGADKTYIAYGGNGYLPFVTYFDHVNKEFGTLAQIATTPPGDSHYLPSMLIDKDNYIHVFYGCHNSPLYYKRSTGTLDLDNWTTMGTVDSYSTYPQSWQDSGGTIGVFYRSGAAADWWSWRKSSDDGSSWGTEHIVMGGTYNPVAILRRTGDDELHMVWTQGPGVDSPYRHLYYAHYGTDGTWKTVAGSALTEPIGTAQWGSCQVYNCGTLGLGGIRSGFDDEYNPYILFVVGETYNSGTYTGTFVPLLARWIDETWQIGTIGSIVTTGNVRNIGEIDIQGTADWTVYVKDPGSNTGLGGTTQIFKSTTQGTVWNYVGSVCDKIRYTTNIVTDYTGSIKLVLADSSAGTSGRDLYLWNISGGTSQGTGTGAPPVAALSGTPTSGTIPLTVQFNDDSTGVPTAWAWTFGDGTTGTTENPPHDYLGTGSFTVILEVSNADGTDSATSADYIITGLAPTASFSGTPTSGAIELGVQFTFDGTGSPDNYLWNFGNGTTGTQDNPSATYTTVGHYTVSLTVDNYWGTDTATKTDYITALGTPIAVLSGTPTSGAEPLTVQFNDDSTGIPTTWVWTFGDGTTGTIENPEHIYLDDGTYTVSLEVSNVCGTDNATNINYIIVHLPGGGTEGSQWQLRFTHLSSEDYLIPIYDMADYPNEMYQEEIGKDEYVAEEGGFYQYTHWNKKKCKFHFMDVDKDCMGTMQIFALGTQAFAVYAGTYATSYGNLLGTFYYADKRWKPTETIDGLFNFDFPIREK